MQGKRFKLGIVSTRAGAVFIVVGIVVAMICVGIWYGVRSYNYGMVQDRFARDQEGSVNSRFNSVNMQLNTKISTINGVSANPLDFNLNLMAGSGIAISPNASDNSVKIDAFGPAIDNIVSTDGSIQITLANTTIDLSNNGVTSLNALTGGLVLTAKDGITIMENDTEINICAPGITSAIANLQQEDANQAMQIMELQEKNLMQDMEIEALSNATAVLSSLFNSTDMDLDMFNMTLVSLLSQISMLQMQVDALQIQVDNTVPTPTGTMVPWTGTIGAIPAGYLYCDNAEYSIASYGDLFAVVGTMYCGGLGCAMGMFRVPEMRGRVPVGLGGGGVFTIQGQTVGTETVVMTEAQMPNHSHGGVTSLNGDHFHNAASLSAGNHIHSWNVQFFSGEDNFNTGMLCPTEPLNTFGNTACHDAGDPGDFMLENLQTNNFGAHTHTIETFTTGAHTHNISPGGNSAPHPNVQPSLVVHYMIKT